MDLRQAIAAVVERRNLAGDEMEQVMRGIMRGDATPAQIGGLLIGLRMKGETVDELAAAARVMREFATRVATDPAYLVDTAGTGGDGTNTFNISTAAAFVAAAAGARVAKHGNRSVSSACGSADVLEAAGVRIDLPPEAIGRCIDQVGVGFMFAPAHHGATRHAAGPRRELGVRTMFNLLGPLTNPAGAPNQVLGVFARHWVEPACRALRALGSRHVLVVHSDDGLDEISIGAPTLVAELRDGEVATYTLAPERFGIARQSIAPLRVDSAAASLALIRAVLSDRPGPARDIVCLNAGAAIYAAGVTDTLEEGVERARAMLASGAAAARLQALIDFTGVPAGA